MKLKIWTTIFTAMTLANGMAATAKSLVVYTSRKEHLIKDIFQQYTKETGVEVKYKTGKSFALIESLKAEGSQSPADLFMTVDAGSLWFAGEQGLLTKVASKRLQTNIPSHLRDRNGQWFGLSVRARTVVYNSNRLKETELSTYENLANEKWKGRLCLRTSKKVYNQALVAMLIHELGAEKAREVVSGWVKNAVDIFSSDNAVLSAVASGRCDVGIVNSYYYGRLMKKSPKLPLKLFWPNQKGSYGVHINISGAGVLKASKKKGAAIKFLEWLSDKKAQRSFAQVNMEHTVHPSVKESEEVSAWGDFHPNTDFHLSDAGRLQKDAIKLMLEANYR